MVIFSVGIPMCVQLPISPGAALSVVASLSLSRSVYYGSEQGYSGGNDPTNREALAPNFNRSAALYLFIQKAIALRRHSNVSLQSQFEILVTDSVYAFSRGKVVVIVTNSNSQYSLQLPVAPFSVGDVVCDHMQQQPNCDTVGPNGYSLKMSGEAIVAMRA
jgi:glycosidase